jgi:hypothetical protein
MACRFKIILVLLVLSAILSGCLSLRIEKAAVGNALPGTLAGLKENKSTLDDALKICGAPDEILDLKGEIALIYEKGLYTGANLGLGIPISESTGPDINLSGYGRLWKYDRLALFFSPDWVLMHSVYVKGSEDPYFESLFKDDATEKAKLKGNSKTDNIKP